MVCLALPTTWRLRDHLSPRPKPQFKNAGVMQRNRSPQCEVTADTTRLATGMAMESPESQRFGFNAITKSMVSQLFRYPEHGVRQQLPHARVCESLRFMCGRDTADASTAIRVCPTSCGRTVDRRR